MEHLLCECLHYSQFILTHLGEFVTQFLTNNAQDLVPQVELGQLLNILHKLNIKPCTKIYAVLVSSAADPDPA
jgi:hypothetical protein